MSHTILAWNQLVASVNGTTTIGTTGVRDPDYPCEGFNAVGAAFHQVTEFSTMNRCETDGHYMCTECTEISIGELRRRQGRCEECGSDLERDVCLACDPP